MHIATIARMAHDPDTRAYVDKRRAEGRTTKEIRRILERYLARQICRTLNTADAARNVGGPGPGPTPELSERRRSRRSSRSSRSPRG